MKSCSEGGNGKQRKLEMRKESRHESEEWGKKEPWMEWDGEIWAGPRGVYIRLGSALVWQREMWVHLEVIHHLYQGKLQEADRLASRYVSILPVRFLLPLPLPFIFIWKHEQMWGKQQISAVWLLACSFQLITDEHRGSVVPNCQWGDPCRAPVLSPRELKFLMFTSSCLSLSFFSFQRCWTWNLWLIFILYVSWRRKKSLSRTLASSFINHKRAAELQY